MGSKSSIPGLKSWIDLAPRAIEDVQSYEREGAVVLLAILPEVLPFHEAQINLVGQVADVASYLVGVGAHSFDVGKADVPVEVGDGRRVFLIRPSVPKTGCPGARMW